jgi:hypothetical protein
MTAKKPIPRAVLEERLRVLEERQARRRMFAVSTGVYVAMVFGVLASQAIVMSDDLSASLSTLELSQVAGGMLVAGVLYNKLENDKPKDLEGKAKKGNVFRVLRAAFYHGMTWMTLLGAWW